jgi:hypothetical protein
MSEKTNLGSSARRQLGRSNRSYRGALILAELAVKSASVFWGM